MINSINSTQKKRKREETRLEEKIREIAGSYLVSDCIPIILDYLQPLKLKTIVSIIKTIPFPSLYNWTGCHFPNAQLLNNWNLFLQRFQICTPQHLKTSGRLYSLVFALNIKNYLLVIEILCVIHQEGMYRETKDTWKIVTKIFLLMSKYQNTARPIHLSFLMWIYLLDVPIPKSIWSYNTFGHVIARSIAHKSSQEIALLFFDLDYKSPIKHFTSNQIIYGLLLTESQSLPPYIRDYLTHMSYEGFITFRQKACGCYGEGMDFVSQYV